MATVFIQKRKCKSYNSYTIRYKDPITHKTKHYKVFRRHRETIYAAHELRMLIDHGKLYENAQTKYRLNLLTFDNTAKQTVQAWKGRLKKGSLKQVTYEGYCLRLELVVRKFGKRMLWEIRKEEIETYLEQLTLDQSVTTANRTLFIFDYQGKGLINLFRTKNGVRRTVPLMPRTKQALLHWQKHLAWTSHRKRIDSNGSALVFCRMDGRPIKGFRKSWLKICKIAGIEDFCYHGLRHTFCSNLLLSGASLKDVKDMIGHRHLETTDRYTHITGFHKAQLYERPSAYYAQGGWCPNAHLSFCQVRLGSTSN